MTIGVVNVYKLHSDVSLPKFGTDYATCFDLEYFPVGGVIKGYNENNYQIEKMINDDGSFTIYPGERLLVPTGLVFNIGERRIDGNIVIPDAQTYSLRLHARSGLALKRGLVLANSEGIVDIDYNLEVFVLMLNISKITQTITKKERICQGEIVRNETFRFYELREYPKPVGDRSGGFGSTGTV